MVEIDINPNFESKVMKYHRNKTLSEIIRSCDRSIHSKVRGAPATKNTDVKKFDELLGTFLCSFSSIEEHVGKRDIFKREDKLDVHNLTKIYSLYAASKSALNRINDESVEKVRGYELLSNASSLNYADIDQKSDYSLLTNILSKLKDVRAGNNVNSLKYNYFSFFDRLRDMSKNYIKSKCHPDTIRDLNQIKIYKTGLDFNEIPPPEKKDFSKEDKKPAKKEEGLEKLPVELPPYEPRRYPSLEKVVGNSEAVLSLRAAMIKTLKYDPKLKANPFSMGGYSFKDAFIVHGNPGVGKNFTIDALFNYYNQAAKEQGIEVEFVDLSKGIKSYFKDKTSMVFERYLSIEKEGGKSYFNLIDEGDGVFTKNDQGEMSESSKKLLREMKAAINNSEKKILYIF